MGKDKKPDKIEVRGARVHNPKNINVDIPLNEIGPLEINSYTYASLPKCYTFMDADALNSSGITRLHNHPYLKLQGEGTVIAVIDSGIDYLNPIFRNGDVSRIAYIWDQTIPGNEDEQVPYGKVFTGEEWLT